MVCHLGHLFLTRLAVTSTTMERFAQSPTASDFVQNPYPAYDRARDLGDLVWWEDYAMPAATSWRAVNALLRDRRFGREAPPETAPEIPERLGPFYAIEAHSMLELEPPRHTRLRGLVVRAFTSARIAALRPEIERLCDELIQDLPAGPFDLLDALCRPLPVRVVARLLGVPETKAPDLLTWSNAMVGMYQAGRTRAMEDAAVTASIEFREWLITVIEMRRAAPGDDLLSQLISVEEDGDRLSRDELITTVILLLNAGHEATVHTLGNGIAAILRDGHAGLAADPEAAPDLVEEILRHDPPLHLFTRHCYEDVDLFGHSFRRGDQVALLLAAANRDPSAYEAPATFDPTRRPKPNASFGAGIHFCVGAPLARLEMTLALPALFRACPDLRCTEPPRYAPIYHFHGLERLMVEARS